MNHYPLPETERTSLRAIRDQLIDIFEDYGDGMNPNRSMGGVEAVMNCIVRPLLETGSRPQPDDSLIREIANLPLEGDRKFRLADDEGYDSAPVRTDTERLEWLWDNGWIDASDDDGKLSKRQAIDAAMDSAPGERTR